ncbi:MAG: alpha/beta hydrolase [Pseudomonadota bacterium]
MQGQFDVDWWKDAPRQRADGIAWVEIGRRNTCPVVLIHGVGLRAESWMRVGRGLALRHRVLMVDVPGHGDSEPLGPDPKLADFSDRIARLMATLDQPAVIAGHSMGALIVLDLAVRHPSLVAACMPCNAVYRRSPEASQAVKARAAALAASGGMDILAPLQRWFPDDGIYEDERAACQRWLEISDLTNYAAAYRVFAVEDGPSDGTLRNLRCPMTYLTGALEPNSTPGMSEAMAEMTPDAEAAIIPSSHHMTPMTHSDAVTKALLRLIDRAGLSSPAGRRQHPTARYRN